MNIKRHFLFVLVFVIGQSGLYAQIDHWETAVFADDTWSYRLGTSEPPGFWMQPGFDDSSWLTGQGGFGYGDDDDETIIPTTLSLYIRTTFEVTDINAIEQLLLHADYDDAFVAYLNGQEFARGNFPDNGATPAYNEIPPTDHEASLYQGDVPEAFSNGGTSIETYLQPGTNTLAIQVHNFLITSSDMTSNFFLSFGINNNSFDYGITPDWFYEPFVSFNLPLIRISTNGLEIMDEPRIVADMEVVDNGAGNLNYIDDPANDYNGKIAIEIRGASSQSFPKKNYGFETQDELGENNNVPLLGMPEENDWILHGPFSDKSLIRNALTFDIGREMMDYASRIRFCELIINEDYRGVYLLMERIKRDTFRVDIATLRPEDIEGDELTGGYIIQLDRDDEDTEEDGWYSPHGNNPFYAYHNPDYDDLLPVQEAYIRDWMSHFEDLMEGPNYANLYSGFLDMESFVDYFLINELTKHIDAFKLSFYMYKRKDSNGGKLHLGPIWDFNLGYSNFDFDCMPEPQGWIYPCTSRAFWFNRLLELPEVQNQIHCRWDQLQESTLDVDNLMNRIEEMVAEIGPAKDRNFIRWNIMGNYVWPNYFIGEDHEEEITFLKNWLANRINWMDNNMLGMPLDCVSSNEEFSPSETIMETFPNPFADHITFQFQHPRILSGQLHIYDAIGQLVKIQMINSDEPYTWNTEKMAAGIYFYEMNLGTYSITGKVIRD